MIRDMIIWSIMNYHDYCALYEVCVVFVRNNTRCTSYIYLIIRNLASIVYLKC